MSAPRSGWDGASTQATLRQAARERSAGLVVVVGLDSLSDEELCALAFAIHADGTAPEWVQERVEAELWTRAARRLGWLQ